MTTRRVLQVFTAILVSLPIVVATQQPTPQQGGRQQQWGKRTVGKIVPGEWRGPRLADGQPDVSGHWSNTVGNHNNLTDPQGPLAADDEPGGRPRAVRPRKERAP